MIGLIFFNFMFQMFSMISLRQDLRVKKTMKIMFIGLCLLKKKRLSVYGYQSSQPVFAPIARPRSMGNFQKGHLNLYPLSMEWDRRNCSQENFQDENL
jgi:hypothetical protein